MGCLFLLIAPFIFLFCGVTSLRRFRMMSRAGSTPTWVKIEGVLHEFSHLTGVREDMDLHSVKNLAPLRLILPFCDQPLVSHRPELAQAVSIRRPGAGRAGLMSRASRFSPRYARPSVS